MAERTISEISSHCALNAICIRQSLNGELLHFGLMLKRELSRDDIPDKSDTCMAWYEWGVLAHFAVLSRHDYQFKNKIGKSMAIEDMHDSLGGIET